MSDSGMRTKPRSRSHSASHAGDGAAPFGNICSVCGQRVKHTGLLPLTYLTVYVAGAVVRSVRHADAADCARA